jgi:hypothetical protein
MSKLTYAKDLTFVYAQYNSNRDAFLAAAELGNVKAVGALAALEDITSTDMQLAIMAAIKSGHCDTFARLHTLSQEPEMMYRLIKKSAPQNARDKMLKVLLDSNHTLEVRHLSQRVIDGNRLLLGPATRFFAAALRFAESVVKENRDVMLTVCHILRKTQISDISEYYRQELENSGFLDDELIHAMYSDKKKAPDGECHICAHESNRMVHMHDSKCPSVCLTCAEKMSKCPFCREPTNRFRIGIK